MVDIMTVSVSEMHIHLARKFAQDRLKVCMDLYSSEGVAVAMRKELDH